MIFTNFTNFTPRFRVRACAFVVHICPPEVHASVHPTSAVVVLTVPFTPKDMPIDAGVIVKEPLD